MLVSIKKLSRHTRFRISDFRELTLLAGQD
jgi:hypothetical protein